MVNVVDVSFIVIDMQVNQIRDRRDQVVGADTTFAAADHPLDGQLLGTADDVLETPKPFRTREAAQRSRLTKKHGGTEAGQQAVLKSIERLREGI